MKFVERSGFQSQIFLTPSFRAPWGVCTDRTSEVVFHLMVRGTCNVNLGKVKSAKAEVMLPGDIIVFPRGEAHSLFDDSKSELISHSELMQRAKLDLPDLWYGGRGVEAKFICGSFSMSAIGAELLLSALPKKILIQAHDRADPQMEQVLRMLAREHTDKNIGYELVVNGLLRILFVCLLRHCQRQLEGTGRGMLYALRVPFLAAALREMHVNFQMPWDLTKLAAVAKTSRAKFARDFAAAVGQTPAKYLNLVRMNEAEALLRDTELSVKEISHRVGFSSSEVFIRNFSKQFGASPAAFRRVRC